MEVRVRNHRKTDVEVEVILCLPRRWRSSPERVALKVPAGRTVKGAFELTVPLDWTGPDERRAIAGDVVANGVYLGQIAEAVVDVRSAKDMRRLDMPDERL
jgi:hypothetical protein